MKGLIWLFFSLFLHFISLEAISGDECDSLWNKCELDCLENDSNPDACNMCCDLVHNMCLNTHNKLHLGGIQDKFNHCFDRDDILFSKRLDVRQHERKDVSEYPQPKQNHTFEHGSFSLASNVLILDRMDYIDCIDADLSSETSYIKLDYNEFTYKIKIGTIIVMDKDTYLSLEESDHCQHAPASKVIDLEIKEDNKNGNYILLTVKIPELLEYFQYLSTDIPPTNVHKIDSKSTIEQKLKEKTTKVANDVTDSVMYVPSKDPSMVYTCWFVLDDKYAVKRLDVRVCEHYQSLQAALMEANATKSDSKTYFNTKNSFNNNKNNKNDDLSNLNNLNNSKSNRNLLFWKPKKGGFSLKGAVEWVKEKSEDVVKDVGNAVVNELEDVAETTLNTLKDIGEGVLVIHEEIGEAIDDALDELEDIIVAVGDVVYEGISAAVEFFQQLIEGEISFTKTYGIWLDSESYSETYSAGAQDSKPVGNSKYFEVSYDVAGSITVDYGVTLKFGGQIGLIAQISLDPIGITQFKLYAVAGFGFDIFVDILMEASAELCLTGKIEKESLIWIGVIPVVITFQTSLAFCLNIDTAFEFQFHTGIGEYTREYGIELNNGDLELYKEVTNTLRAPGLDFAYNMNQGESYSSCFTMSFTPSVTFEAGIIFYKTIGISVDFPLETSIGLEYPSNSCNNYCVSGTNQKLGVIFNDITLKCNLNLGFENADDLQQAIDILGLDNIPLEQSFELFSLTLADFSSGNRNLCVNFNFAALLTVCCGNSFSTNSGNTGDQDISNSLTNVGMVDGEDVAPFDVGMNYLIPNTVYTMRNVYDDSYLYYDGTTTPDTISNDNGNDNRYWLVFVDLEKTKSYYFVNKDGLSDNNFRILIYDNDNNRMTFVQENDYNLGKSAHLVFDSYDDNGNARYMVKFEYSQGVELCLINSVLTPTFNMIIISICSYGTKQLWYFEEASKYILPAEFTEYWIQPWNQQSNYIGVESDGSTFVTSGMSSSFNRWMIQKFDYNHAKIYLSPELSDSIDSTEYILCSAAELYIENNLPKWRYVLKLENDDFDFVSLNCKWEFTQYTYNGNIWYRIETRYGIQFRGSLTVLSGNPYLEDEGNNHKWNRYRMQFNVVPPSADYPQAGQTYRIRNTNNNKYITCTDWECTGITMNSNIVNNNKQKWTFTSISDVQDNLFRIQTATWTKRTFDLANKECSPYDENNGGQKVKLIRWSYIAGSMQGKFFIEVDEGVKYDSFGILPLTRLTSTGSLGYWFVLQPGDTGRSWVFDEA